MTIYALMEDWTGSWMDLAAVACQWDSRYITKISVKEQRMVCDA
jgi:hypothetical protein